MARAKSKLEKKLEAVVDNVIERGDSNVEAVKEAESERYVTICCPLCLTDHYKIDKKVLSSLLKEDQPLKPEHMEPVFDRRIYRYHNHDVTIDCVYCGSREIFVRDFKTGRFTFNTREKGVLPSVRPDRPPGIRIRRVRYFYPNDSAYRLRRLASRARNAERSATKAKQTASR